MQAVVCLLYLNELRLMENIVYLNGLTSGPTISSKIIRALEIISVKKDTFLMQFYEINIYKSMIFRFYVVFNRHQLIKIGNQTREKSQELSQCSNNFAADCSFFMVP